MEKVDCWKSFFNISYPFRWTVSLISFKMWQPNENSVLVKSIAVTEQWGVALYWPVHTEGAQVEDSDANRSFLQERKQLAKAQAEHTVIKWKAGCQQLLERQNSCRVFFTIFSLYFSLYKIFHINKAKWERGGFK